MCITHKPASTPMVANCAARFSQDIVHKSLIYKHIIHIANTCAVLCTSVPVLVDVKLTHTTRKTQPISKKINGRSKAVLLLWIFYGGGGGFCLVFAMPLFAFVYMCLVVTCWEGLTSWLSFVVSNCECVTFPLVSWVRCGT